MKTQPGLLVESPGRGPCHLPVPSRGVYKAPAESPSVMLPKSIIERHSRLAAPLMETGSEKTGSK